MREIKFRGKGQTDGKWHYGLLVLLTDAVCHIKDKYTTWICDAKTVGQYTGLKDREGVEIYEGDILEGYSVYPTGCDFYSHVKGEAYYSCRGTWDCYSFLLGDLNEQLEVIGNINERSHE